MVAVNEKLGENLQDESQKTIRHFDYEGNLWSIIDQWAVETGFKMIKKENKENNESRWYKKRGWIDDFAMLQISSVGSLVDLNAWVHLSVNRKPYFFGRRENMKLESNAFKPVWFSVGLHSTARKDVNKLLIKLDQPPII
jgi:hypothetical protein